MTRPKIIVAAIASAILATVSFTSIDVVQSQPMPTRSAPTTTGMDFTDLQERKFCSKISVLDDLIAKHGSQQLILKSKESGQTPDFRLLVYYDAVGKKFTIVKTYAKKNQACIVMSGYDVELEAGVSNPSIEPKE